MIAVERVTGLRPRCTRGPHRGRLVLLAPPDSPVPPHFVNVDGNANLHDQLLDRMQRFRGELYLAEGAIQPSQIAADGCHRQGVDKQAWHLLMLDQKSTVYGCSRYTAYPNTVSFSELGVANCPLATSATWGRRFRAAVESEIDLARQRGVAYVEVGGWALAPEMRHTAEALRIALGTYSLAEMLGGCIGIATATLRHHSTSILRRIGGRSLMASGFELPRYRDSQYGCNMEILCFDSAVPDRRFAVWIDEMCKDVLTAPVIRGEHSMLRLHEVLTSQGLEGNEKWSPRPHLSPSGMTRVFG